MELMATIQAQAEAYSSMLNLSVSNIPGSLNMRLLLEVISTYFAKVHSLHQAFTS